MKNRSSLLAIALHIAVVPSIVAAGLGAAAAENPEDRAPMPLEATLKIHTARKVQNPISPHITGKFCEHLFFNITNGMDAQILKNPTLCDYPFRSEQMSPDGLATFMHDRDEIAGRIRNDAPRTIVPVATTVRIADGMLRLDLKPYSLTCIEVSGES